jgi:putative ABC transport system substrate-binding protein
VRRRTFVKFSAGAAAATIWPLTAKAQQGLSPVVGFLDSGSPDGMTDNLAAFRRGVSETGLAEGAHFTIDFRWAEGRYDRLPELAADLVRRSVAVIAATRSSAPARAAKGASGTIPIVFQTGSDPVKDGLVVSMNRPGGNVTGVTRLSTALVAKRLGVIAELLPKAKLIALLVNPGGPQTPEQIREMEEAARVRGLGMNVVKAGNAAELSGAFTEATRAGVQALVVATDNLFIDRRAAIVALAATHGIPAMYPERGSVAAGGLMAYAASLEDSFRQAGVYVGRILKGARAADLPVLQPDKFELVINLKTAKALGLAMPPTLLAIADEVIE